MKRFIFAMIISLVPLNAAASTDLARQWGLEASRLAEQTFELMHAVDLGQSAEISDRFAIDIHRFGRTSSELGRWIDQANGPTDLGCIFRGMASEAEDQLYVLEAGSELITRRESLHRLAGMFADAEVIAIAAQRRSPTTGRVATAMHATCEADPDFVLGSLR